MAIDRRELLLARLFEVAQTLPNIQTSKRNRGLLDNDMRPAIVLMDGDERFRLTGDRRGRQRMSPSIVTMYPQLFILLKVAQPQNENVGQDLNAYRVEMIRLVAQDTVLLDLVTANGNVSYEGCETDLKSGRPALGSMRLDFAITYVLDPYQL